MWWRGRTSPHAFGSVDAGIAECGAFAPLTVLVDLHVCCGSHVRGPSLSGLYEDANGAGRLHELNISTYIATRSVRG